MWCTLTRPQSHLSLSLALLLFIFISFQLLFLFCFTFASLFLQFLVFTPGTRIIAMLFIKHTRKPQISEVGLAQPTRHHRFEAFLLLTGFVSINPIDFIFIFFNKYCRIYSPTFLPKKKSTRNLRIKIITCPIYWHLDPLKCVCLVWVRNAKQEFRNENARKRKRK